MRVICARVVRARVPLCRGRNFGSGGSGNRKQNELWPFPACLTLTSVGSLFFFLNLPLASRLDTLLYSRSPQEGTKARTHTHPPPTHAFIPPRRLAPLPPTHAAPSARRRPRGKTPPPHAPRPSPAPPPAPAMTTTRGRVAKQTRERDLSTGLSGGWSI